MRYEMMWTIHNAPKGKSVSKANQNVALFSQITCENFAY